MGTAPRASGCPGCEAGGSGRGSPGLKQQWGQQDRGRARSRTHVPSSNGGRASPRLCLGTCTSLRTHPHGPVPGSGQPHEGQSCVEPRQLRLSQPEPVLGSRGLTAAAAAKLAFCCPNGNRFPSLPPTRPGAAQGHPRASFTGRPPLGGDPPSPCPPRGPRRARHDPGPGFGGG